MNILNVTTQVDVYSDQTNITVNFELENRDAWVVQTNRHGVHSVQDGCNIWLNDNDKYDLTEHNNYDLIVSLANDIASKKLLEIN